MGNLVEVKNNQVVTTSRQVAENFGKAHKSVLRSIHALTSAQNCANVFQIRYLRSSAKNLLHESRRFFSARYGFHRTEGY